MNPNSKTERLEPIASPPGHFAREFCHRFLPVLVFAGAGVATALLWNQRFSGTQLFGEVEPITASANTLEGGTLLDLQVERFQTVTNGQVIATLLTTDPDLTQQELAAMRAEVEIAKAKLAIDETRNDQDLEGVRMRWLEARVSLATARVTYENARRELERAHQLFAQKILSEAEHDSAQSLHDALQAEVKERTTLVEGLQTIIARLESANRDDRHGSTEALAQAVAIHERQLLIGREIKIRAPIAGMIKTIAHRAGERVPASTTLATITSPQSTHIIGYVRQPLVIEPHPGMPIEIHTRGPKRQVVTSTILSVGGELELVTSPLRLRGFDNAVERGLAFMVALPSDLEVHPGELVDLIVRPSR